MDVLGAGTAPAGSARLAFGADGLCLSARRPLAALPCRRTPGAGGATAPGQAPTASLGHGGSEGALPSIFVTWDAAGGTARARIPVSGIVGSALRPVTTVKGNEKRTTQ